MVFGAVLIALWGARAEEPTGPAVPPAAEAPVTETMTAHAAWLPDPVRLGFVVRPDSLVDHRAVFIDVVRSTGRNLWILDASYDRDVPSRWTAKELHVMKLTDPTRRILGMLSVTQAETWREYWDPAWADPKQRPSWLGKASETDPRVFEVQWWDPGWQELIREELDGMLARGFDGVVLSGVDVFLNLESASGVYTPHKKNPKTGHSYREDMIAWVSAVARYTRAPGTQGFKVVALDAAELLSDARYRSLVDAVVVQDMFRYGADRVGYLAGLVERYVDEGGAVLVVEDQRSQGLSPIEAQATVRGLSVLYNGTDRANLGKAAEP